MQACAHAVKKYKDEMRDHSTGHSIAMLGILLRPDAPSNEKTKVLFSYHGGGEAMVVMGRVWMEIFEAGPDEGGKLQGENIIKRLTEIDPGARETFL